MMYKVVCCKKEAVLSEFGADQEKTVTKEELIEMLKDSKIFVISCVYVG